MGRIDELSGGGLPVCNASNPLMPDALPTTAAGRHTAAPCLRPRPCIDRYDALHAGELPRPQGIYTDITPLLDVILAAGLATTGKAGFQPLGAGVAGPRRPLLSPDEKCR